MEILTESAQQTQDFGRTFANKLKGGEILALTGDLGSGKTTFMQGLAQGLGIEDRIISPTFVLVRTYKTASGKNLYHLDLYRLEENIKKELEKIGIEDFWNDEENIIVIEWADRAREIIPNQAIWIDFQRSDGDSRKITVN